jgi:uncharacterized membrane protein YdjX (TVP38/TMEM64 family)
VATGAVVAGVVFKDPLLVWYDRLTDREGIKAYIQSWGAAAPLVFMALQIAQVIFAPIPGELSGFVGGYVFGATYGFIYSSIGLATGSAINFAIGRILGFRYIRKIIPSKNLKKFDRFVIHQGVIVLLGMFLFPGFPKDYLCIFLGATALPFKMFILMAGFGRMPGTLMLSIQGEFFLEKKYGLLAGVVLISLMIVLVAIKYRRVLYRWAESNNKI